MTIYNFTLYGRTCELSSPNYSWGHEGKFALKPQGAKFVCLPTLAVLRLRRGLGWLRAYEKENIPIDGRHSQVFSLSSLHTVVSLPKEEPVRLSALVGFHHLQQVDKIRDKLRGEHCGD